MINIDFLTLKAFYKENIDFIIGSRLQKIQQPTRRDFILWLRNQNESRKLYININPQIYHIAFMSKENEKKRSIEIPKKPPMFCMLLRKHLEGCRIIDVNVVENERIIEFYFETYNEISEKRELCLCVELMGKHSNVILYDKETTQIIGCAHNIGAEKSRYRELKGGLNYVLPPKISENILSDELKVQFKNLMQKDVQKYLDSEVFRPAMSDNKYTLFKELLENSISQNSVNEMLDNYYSKFQEQLNLKSLKDKLYNIAKAKIKKIKTATTKIQNLLNKRDNTEKYKLYGELLTANLYKKCDYQKEIEVFDYINNQNITIELDETKTLKENAQRYYKLYNKSKITKEKSTEILNGLEIEREYMENIVYSIDMAKSVQELDEISSELDLSETKPKEKNALNLLKFEINGYEVYVGKNNRQNDYIISKLSKDEDYWFHTRLCAGSHVLLKLKQKEPDEKTLFECCKLAREYSSAKQPSKVGVIYTKRKYIKKPPKAPLGYVIYKNEKEVLV